jgi:NADPH-dependent 2,4-dienoyl-CoA reductase/sulfur reductase-like enzyme
MTTEAVVEHRDVVIVGAGPAGLGAAAVLRKHGLDVTLIDEQPRAGGQILRQPPRTFTVGRWLTAKLYDRVKAALHEMNDERTDIDWRFSSSVLGILRPSPYRAGGRRAGHELWIQGPSSCYFLHASTVLVAAGCYERPLAFPGWTLPGVMGAGAIQGFVKSQQLVPGNRFLLVGSHPLQLVVADQLLSAGADVAAVVFTQRMQRALAALAHPHVLLRNNRQFLETARMLHRLRRARIPLIFGASILRAEGANAVERATIAMLRPDGAIDTGRQQIFDCDRVGICHGFLASSELPRQAGANVRWREHEGGWLVDHDEWFESSIANLFVAGEVTGVAGADAALEKGRVAAVGMLRALGRVDDDRRAEQLARPFRRRLASMQRFAHLLHDLARPPESLADATMTGETILCRCESIRRDELEQQLRENPHVVSSDAAKLLTRVGMGLCQGRMCGDNAARTLARLRSLSATDVGPFQAQAPVKPVQLGALAPERCS